MFSIKKMIISINPIHLYWKNKNRKRLKNKNFSLLCSNCMGGLMYHELGIKFLSPTINIRINSPDFIKFVCNIHEYLDQELYFIDTNENYPVAKLGDVTIYFVHYKTREQAESKWQERKKRINWDNVWILTNDLDGVNEEDLTRLQSIQYAKGIVVFSSKKYDGFHSIRFIPSCAANGEMINTMKFNHARGRRVFELLFDYVGWLNGEYV